MTDQRRAYRVREFCERLGICRDTFYAWKADGLVRSVRIGRARLIPAEEFDRLLSEYNGADAGGQGGGTETDRQK